MKLNYEKRLVLEKELKAGTKLTDISRILGMDRNSLYAEFKRTGMDRNNYDAREAQLGRGMKIEG